MWDRDEGVGGGVRKSQKNQPRRFYKETQQSHGYEERKQREIF